MDDKPKPLRGLARLSPERRREIAAKGGRAAHACGRAHEFTADEARAAGAKGGGLIAQDRAHMAAIGQRGGKALSAKFGPEHMAAIGRRGGRIGGRNRKRPA